MSDLESSAASTHPDDLLAGLVDGTLTAAERTEVQAHLDGCERCREEVRLAESARHALRALPDVEAPWGLGRAAVEEARKSSRAPRFRRLAPAAGVAAAALLLVGLAFAVLRGPQHEAANQAGGAPAAAPTAGGSVPPQGAGGSAPLIQRVPTNYDAAAIQHLAADYAKSREGVFSPASTAPAAPLPSAAPIASPSATAETADRGVSGTPSENRSAVRVPLNDEDRVVACIDSAAGLDQSARPERVIVARFDEKPALIGIYLSGPGGAQPADLLVIWVASRQCQILHYASHRISP